MLFGINYMNDLDQPRTTVYNASSLEDAEEKFFSNKNNRTNKIISISEITSDVCSILYQSGREIIHEEEINFRTIIDGGDITVEIDNVPYFHKTIRFEQKYLHFTNNMLEVMVCVHDGTPNWLY